MAGVHTSVLWGPNPNPSRPWCRLQGFGISATSVRLVGGGSNNPLWRQVIADVLGLPVRLPLVAESAALGAALQAAAVHGGADVAEFVAAHPPAMEAGEVEPDAGSEEAYAEALRRHTQSGSALFGTGSPM